jgi:hypothetical protein
MKSNFCFKAQGAVEYLVIISVVIVIVLIVVGLFTNLISPNIISIRGSSEKVGDISTGGISIVESVADSNGDSLILVSNNSSDGIVLKKISVGGVENSYDAVISGLDSKSISLDGLESVCPCESGKRSTKCEFKFEYLTGNKVTKVEYRTVSVECVNRVVASNGNRVVNPIVEEVVLEDGTSEHPWIINNCLELQDMNQHLDGNYILGNDIDCSDTVNWNDEAGFKPIGFCVDFYCSGGENISFKGTLDGNDYTIDGLIILDSSSPTNTGLFRNLTGTVKNLNLTNTIVQGNLRVGGIAGRIHSGGKLSNVHFSGIVSGGIESIGGLAGALGGIGEAFIIGSSVTGKIYGGNYVGGLLGSGDGVTTRSYFNGYIDGGDYVGGITGQGGRLIEVYALGRIYGGDYVGGLEGVNEGGGGILNSYSGVDVYGTNNVGGLAGYSGVSINSSYSFGKVVGYGNDIGGFVGAINYSPASFSYWDINTSEVTSSATGVGKTTLEMKTATTFINADWDSDVWSLVDGNYPSFKN